MKKLFVLSAVLTTMCALTFAGCGAKTQTAKKIEEPAASPRIVEETPDTDDAVPAPLPEPPCPDCRDGHFYGFEIILRIPEPFYKGVRPIMPPANDDNVQSGQDGDSVNTGNNGRSDNGGRRKKTPHARLPKKSDKVKADKQ